MLVQLNGAAIGILDLDVPPGVDVDLLDAIRKDVLGQETVLSHFRVEGVHQLVLGHTVHCHALLLEETGNPPFHLGLGVLAVIDDQTGIAAGQKGLHLLQQLIERHPFFLGGKKDIARLGRDLAFSEDRPASGFLKGDVMHFCLLRLCTRRSG